MKFSQRICASFGLGLAAAAVLAGPASASTSNPTNPPVTATPVQTRAQIIATLEAGQQQVAAQAPLGPAAASSSQAPAALSASVSNNHDYIIYSGDGTNVINAKGCTPNTILITYPFTPNGCGSTGGTGAKNEIWDPVLLTDGYVAMAALLPGAQFTCMNASNGTGNGAQVTTGNTSGCPFSGIPPAMQFRQPQNTPDGCYSGWNYIVPAANFGQTFNVAGGLGANRNIIFWNQGCYTNDAWYFLPTNG